MTCLLCGRPKAVRLGLRCLSCSLALRLLRLIERIS